MQHKLRVYFEAGVDLVWLVEPRQRAVEVFTAPGSKTSLKETQLLMGGDLLPGFRLKVAQLFAGA